MSNCSLIVTIMPNKVNTRNKEAKIKLIYDTFFNLILEKGYHKVSTNHIADSANIAVGTIYRYFPKGKEDIMRNYFNESMDTFLDKQDLISINNDNIRDFLNSFCIELVQNHKQNKGYHLAFRSAIQSDDKLHNTYKERVFSLFKNRTRQLRKINENFNQIPEKELLEVFVFIYNLVNALLYHHLFVMELFSTDNKLIDYLTKIVAFSLNYYKDFMKFDIKSKPERN